MSAPTSAADIQHQKFSSLGFSHTIVNAEQVSTYSRNLGFVSTTNPVLVLLHGYPSSAYLWRHLIPLLPKDSPIFVPDLPGYGTSPPVPSDKHDKLTIGSTVLSALSTQIQRSTSKAPSPIPIILIGHDRGARVAHRLTVSGFPGVEILGACLVDIVPTITQWKASQNAREVVGFFHWPMLANVEFAKRLILAYGGDKWATYMILHWAGKNPKGLEFLKSDDSLRVYGEFFKDERIIEASNKDYEAGATVDIDQQKEDQENGRKIGVPLLLIYSESYLGSRYDVPKEWEDWVDKGVKVDSLALGDGIGHFGIEEAPKESAESINQWLKGLGVQI